MSTKQATYEGDNDSETSMADYLAQHPRLMGVLFTAMLLLMQAGSVAGSTNAAVSGP